jgi:hypothetical protein
VHWVTARALAGEPVVVQPSGAIKIYAAVNAHGAANAGQSTVPRLLHGETPIMVAPVRKKGAPTLKSATYPKAQRAIATAK